MPFRYLYVLLPSLLLTLTAWEKVSNGPFYRCSDGVVHFISDAPLEKIEARSERLRGAVDAGTNAFAWTVAIRSFKGFNSDLQLEHFNENYMESDRFTDATFEGKIIEDIDFNKDGVYQIRAKGRLTIHGITRERILPGQVTVKGNQLTVQARFLVPLQDHDISIPKIVHQKIAEEIQVVVEAKLKKQP